MLGMPVKAVRADGMASAIQVPTTNKLILPFIAVPWSRVPLYRLLRMSVGYVQRPVRSIMTQLE